MGKWIPVNRDAETMTYPCGRCTEVSRLGKFISESIDPDCEQHKKYPCKVCGELVDSFVISHGTFGGSFHTVERKDA